MITILIFGQLGIRGFINVTVRLHAYIFAFIKQILRRRDLGDPSTPQVSCIASQILRRSGLLEIKEMTQLPSLRQSTQRQDYLYLRGITCVSIRSFFRFQRYFSHVNSILEPPLQKPSLDMSSNTPSSPGNFSYPPPGTQLHFNYVDSLMTSWLTFDQNPTDCRLSIWYWPNADPWKVGMSKHWLSRQNDLRFDLKISTHYSDELLTECPHQL